MKDAHGLLLVHEDLVPPERATADSVAGAEWTMQYTTRKHGGAFFALRPELALRTADCYAHFAGEARLGHEAPYAS